MIKIPPIDKLKNNSNLIYFLKRLMLIFYPINSRVRRGPPAIPYRALFYPKTRQKHSQTAKFFARRGEAVFSLQAYFGNTSSTEKTASTKIAFTFGCRPSACWKNRRFDDYFLFSSTTSASTTPSSFAPPPGAPPGAAPAPPPPSVAEACL